MVIEMYNKETKLCRNYIIYDYLMISKLYNKDIIREKWYKIKNIYDEKTILRKFIKNICW